MAQVITFIGWHNSGKTTLLTRVVKELKARGWRIAVLKSSSHSGIEFDRPDTDTFRLKEAGADSVALVAPDQLVLMEGGTRMSLKALAHRFFPDAHLVIGEGFKDTVGVDKIEVVKQEEMPSLYREAGNVVAVVSEKDAPGTRVFRPGEVKELTSFIEKRYILKDMDKPAASLLVNGTPIPLKFFVQQAIAGAVAGLVDSLKGTRNAETIEILVKVPKDR